MLPSLLPFRVYRDKHVTGAHFDSCRRTICRELSLVNSGGADASKISFVSRTPPFFISSSCSIWGLITSERLTTTFRYRDFSQRLQTRVNRNECNEENNGKQINVRPKERTIELGPFRRLVKTRTALRISPKHGKD
jgi:hypothetical protein